MAFNKFDPYAPDEEEGLPEQTRRRVWLLKWGWWITVAYTALGFGFIAYWILTDA